jgi:hypothetical protein
VEGNVYENFESNRDKIDDVFCRRAKSPEGAILLFPDMTSESLKPVS